MKVLYTVGHSTRTWAEFAALLEAHGIRRLADVRRFPHSTRVHWANAGRLRTYLRRRGIVYVHAPDLGGRRKTHPDSPNGAWRSAAFRGYADHMMTGEFRRGWLRLARHARRRRTAVMCAEAVPWRCHRSLLGDYAIVEGWEVRDIMSPTNARKHKLPAWARVRKGRLSYPVSRRGPDRLESTTYGYEHDQAPRRQDRRRDGQAAARDLGLRIFHEEPAPAGLRQSPQGAPHRRQGSGRQRPGRLGRGGHPARDRRQAGSRGHRRRARAARVRRHAL